MTLQAPRPIPPSRINDKSLSRISMVFIFGVIAASAINGAILKLALYIADVYELVSWGQSIALGFAWIMFRFVDSVLFNKT